MSIVIKFIQPTEIADSNVACQFNRQIENVVQSGLDIIVLDLRNLTLINSFGLLTLVKAFKTVRSAGGKLYICSVSEQVRMLFELTGIDQVFDNFASLESLNNTEGIINYQLNANSTFTKHIKYQRSPVEVS